MLKLNKLMATTGAAFTMGAMASSQANAAAATDTGSFNGIAESIVTNISNLPGLLTALSYMMGLIFSVLGILKIKDHVENPTQAQLKDGAIRLAAGGALFLLPVVTTAMQNLIGADGTAITAGQVNAITMGVSTAAP